MSWIFTFMRILFLVVDFLAAIGGTRSAVEWGANARSLPPEQSTTLLHTKASAIAPEEAVHDLASSWCSAYRSSDPERLAALETREIEIVDRFGEWHRLIGLKARVHFWEDGFNMVSLKDFRPACIVHHVRLIGLNAAVVQVKVSYDDGIALKNGDRISRFSEIHTFVLLKVQGTWLITAQNIVQQNSQEQGQGSTPAFSPTVGSKEAILSNTSIHKR